MRIRSVDHLILLVADLEAASAPFQRLGLRLRETMRHAGAGTENRALFVGDAEEHFYVELLAVHDRAAAEAAGRAEYFSMLDSGGGVFRIMLEVEDLPGAVSRLAAAGIRCALRDARREDGSKICDVAVPTTPTPAACEFALIQYVASPAERYAKRKAFIDGHDFPLRHLDHLAAVAPDLPSATAFWGEVLGVPVAGEVRGPGLVLEQLRVGRAVLELLGPDTPDSPLHSRPPGLAPMAAFEVRNLDAAVRLARERGFTIPDPAPGILPNTRTSTIPGAQLSGIAFQLLERTG